MSLSPGPLPNASAYPLAAASDCAISRPAIVRPPVSPTSRFLRGEGIPSLLPLGKGTPEFWVGVKYDGSSRRSVTSFRGESLRDVSCRCASIRDKVF